jgi:hypothetical protein
MFGRVQELSRIEKRPTSFGVRAGSECIFPLIHHVGDDSTARATRRRVKRVASGTVFGVRGDTNGRSTSPTPSWRMLDRSFPIAADRRLGFAALEFTDSRSFEMKTGGIRGSSWLGNCKNRWRIA